MDFKVRRTDAGEWLRLRTIRLAALTTDADSFGTTYERTEATTDAAWQQLAADGAQSPTTAMFAAVTSGGGWIAMSGASVNAEHPDETHVWGVYVVPEHRGGATGAALAVMDAARNWVRDHTTCSHITIHVTAANDHALAFYRRYGFVETGESEPFVLDPTRTLLLMRYDIPR
ncbi:MAG TPA: GNAT family N-acetyltransferase [Nakamurella sp.]